MQKENRDFQRRGKNEEIISRNCLTHHKRASNFTNTNKATPLYFLSMLSRYYAMSENVQRDGSRDCKKETPYFERRKKMKKQFLGTVSQTIRQPERLLTRTNKPDYICFICCRDIMQ
jgi:hypothetical protein